MDFKNKCAQNAKKCREIQYNEKEFLADQIDP